MDRIKWTAVNIIPQGKIFLLLKRIVFKFKVRVIVVFLPEKVMGVLPGLLVAQQSVSRPPLLVAQMTEEWLNYYRKIAQVLHNLASSRSNFRFTSTDCTLNTEH